MVGFEVSSVLTKSNDLDYQIIKKPVIENDALILALALHMHPNYYFVYDFGKDKIVKSPLSKFRLV